jgi:hypothetical protein
MPDDFVHSIWSSRVTPNVRAILACQPEGNLDTVGHCADCIIQTTTQPALASVAPLPENNPVLQHIKDLSRQVAALSAEQAGFNFWEF